jgi:hypothetical protein
MNAIFPSTSSGQCHLIEPGAEKVHTSAAMEVAQGRRAAGRPARGGGRETLVFFMARTPWGSLELFTSLLK